MAPVIETWANKSLFLSRPIIPASREGLLPEYQYSEYTTEAARAIGKLVARMPIVGETRAASPAIIENYVQRWSGGLGMHALRVADLALRKTGVLPDPVRPASTLADIPFIKAFAVRYPTAGAESVQNFYDSYYRQKSYQDTIKALMDDNQPAEAMKIMERAISEGELLRLEGIRTALSNSMKLIRLVYKNPEITSDEKRQIIDSSYYQMIQMAQLGNLIIETSKESAPDERDRAPPISEVPRSSVNPPTTLMEF